MKTSKLAIGWLLACTLGVAQAAKHEIGDFTIDMPDAFTARERQTPAPKSTVYGFVVETAAVPKPVMMVFTQEGAGAPDDTKPAEMRAVLEKLASQALAATERRRTGFQSSAPREIRIAGLQAIDIEWTGKANDIGTSGRMFVFVSGPTAYVFHVMGGAPASGEMLAAVAAVRALKRKP